jgi:hypothetical protein
MDYAENGKRLHDEYFLIGDLSKKIKEAKSRQEKFPAD